MRDRNDEVFSICVAYEQGVGKGRQARVAKEDNPYVDSDEKIAWGYGYDEGKLWLDKQALEDMDNEL